jgi:hypothetical protein
MATYNTASDAANTAVRAFLTKVGEFYLGKSFNTGSGKAKRDWHDIKNEVFNGECAYCGEKSEKLQIEHLIMFNREQYGLHHPGNIVPVCKKCNKRHKDKNNKYVTWDEQLSIICSDNNDDSSFNKRWQKIKKHFSEGDYKYPNLKEAEKNTIRVIANSLFDNIKAECDKSLTMYEKLVEIFVRK